MNKLRRSTIHLTRWGFYITTDVLIVVSIIAAEIALSIFVLSPSTALAVYSIVTALVSSVVTFYVLVSPWILITILFLSIGAIYTRMP